MSQNYAWTKFYESAVLETDSKLVPDKIKAAQHAIGLRAMATDIDDGERHAMVMTLNALTTLWRERCNCDNAICDRCKDENNIVSPLNGTMFLAKVGSDVVVIPLHTTCVPAWADANGCDTLMPLKKRPPNRGRLLYRNVA